MELLLAKGVDINLVKGHLVMDGDWKTVDEERWDRPFDLDDGVPCADAWNQYARSGLLAFRREEVSLWLAERGLGFPTRSNGLTGEDLSDAAELNHVRLVHFLIQHLESKLSPEEYRQALTAALYAAIKGGNDFEFGRVRALSRVDRFFRGPHEEIFEALVAAGADLQQQRPASPDYGEK